MEPVIAGVAHKVASPTRFAEKDVVTGLFQRATQAPCGHWWRLITVDRIGGPLPLLLAAQQAQPATVSGRPIVNPAGRSNVIQMAI